MPDAFYQFRSALIAGQWRDDVVIGITNGRIASIEDSPASKAAEFIDAVALPGMANVHSHAFQRAFAGLSEFRTGERDSFWTWRRLMYDFLLQLTPEDVYVIARQLYLEMLAAGYTWVGEFHYLHNPVGGGVYDRLDEMSDAIARAASDTGIGLCHLPVLYQRGGFENEPLTEGQKRFALSNDEFLELVLRCRARSKENSASNSEQASLSHVGIAFHSLRAVSAKNGIEILKQLQASGFDGPIHLHVAEQTKEVDDCLSSTGMRPVEFLYSDRCGWMNEHAPRWCLIHATHLNESEVSQIADSKAVAGLCPTTEANLGDGFFSAGDFLNRGGAISIGSDSHVGVNLSDELRTLEYGQRLKLQKRAVLGTNEMSVGRRLYEAASRGGAQALATGRGEIAIGERADLTLVDPNHRSIAGAARDRLIDRMIFCNMGQPVCGTVVGGILRMNQSDAMQTQMDESLRAFIQLSTRLAKQ